MDPQILHEMDKLARQKAIIRTLESSDGVNFEHALIKTGPNAGQRAGGAYGILPNTFRDIVIQSKKRNMKVDQSLLVEMKKPSEQITADLNKNPSLDDKIAELGIRLVNDKTDGNEEKTAYLWRTGHNQSVTQLKKGAMSHPYVKAYRKERLKYLAAHPMVVVQKTEHTNEDFIQRIVHSLGLDY